MNNLMEATQVKTVDYYMALPHLIEVVPGDPEEGGFSAYIPSLEGCMTTAETWAELGENIQIAKRQWLTGALEHNMPIAEPATA